MTTHTYETLVAKKNSGATLTADERTALIALVQQRQKEAAELTAFAKSEGIITFTSKDGEFIQAIANAVEYHRINVLWSAAMVSNALAKYTKWAAEKKMPQPKDASDFAAVLASLPGGLSLEAAKGKAIGLDRGKAAWGKAINEYTPGKLTK